MKQIIRNLFTILILIVFLTGTTGVSFYIHECRSSNTREVFAFPEISNKAISCCCDKEVHGSILSEESLPFIEEPPCCTNTHLYLKAAFTGFPVSYQLKDNVKHADLPTYFLNILYDEQKYEMESHVSIVDHPPPLSGKSLVHFLHQIKIPASVS